MKSVQNTMEIKTKELFDAILMTKNNICNLQL